MFGGWRNGNNRIGSNCLVPCPKVTMFLKSVDVFNMYKMHLLELRDGRIV
jgi:hypothetical protein